MELENQFYGSQLSDLRAKIAEFDKTIHEHGEKLHGLKKEKEDAEGEQQQVESSAPKEREELNVIKEKTGKLLEERSKLQKDLGRLEAELEHHKSHIAKPGAPSMEKLSELVKKIRHELMGTLEKDAVEVQRKIQGLLREIDIVLEGGGREQEVHIPPELTARFEVINRDLKNLETEMIDLREKEKTLEKNQEQFYRVFKEAVARVEVAKDRIEKWENENRQFGFEKERVAFRVEELNRQIVQAGRNPDDFVHGQHERLENMQAVEHRIFRLRGDLAVIGEIDEALMKEARETETRYEFLNRESADLEKAVADLRQLIGELNEKIKINFDDALVQINEEFNKFFDLMFGGGQARLRVLKSELKVKKPGDDEEATPEDAKTTEEEQEEKDEDGGIDIDLRLPRKRITSLDMLSGGERSLVGIAALFALISVSPPPFLVLDEIDAALDERNARRFAEMLKEFSKKTQFIVVTHNRATMESANILYGVTLNEDGTSKILSIKLETAEVQAK